MLTPKNVSAWKLGYTIKFLISRTCWKIFSATKFKEQSKKKEGDGNSPRYTSQASFTAQTEKAGFLVFSCRPQCSSL